MVILIAGATHTGKTLLAQKLLEKYKIPYLSIDHLKMGLIRSNLCRLTPESDDTALTEYLWPIIKEIVKTHLENRQNLIIEGCYIPFDYTESFTRAELEKIRYCCLIMSQEYIDKNFDNILLYENVIEKRMGKDRFVKEILIKENEENLTAVRHFCCPYILIDKDYNIEEKIAQILGNVFTDLSR